MAHAWLLLTIALGRELQLTAGAMWGALRAPALCSLVAVCGLALLDAWLQSLEVRPAAALAILLLVGSSLAVLTARLRGARLLGHEMNPVLLRLPLRWQRWLGIST